MDNAWDQFIQRVSANSEAKQRVYGHGATGRVRALWSIVVCGELPPAQSCAEDEADAPDEPEHT